MQESTRRVAVLGGNRIPFARSNTVYSGVSNQEMLTATLDGLIARFGLEGERMGEVVAGAVLSLATGLLSISWLRGQRRPEQYRPGKAAPASAPAAASRSAPVVTEPGTLPPA